MKACKQLHAVLLVNAKMLLHLTSQASNSHRCLLLLLPADVAGMLRHCRAAAPPPQPCCCLQLHAVVMAIFASIIAPFGGFFASGFKRGFKIKDFGDSIPGHGGMTDRMDCQVISASPAASSAASGGVGHCMRADHLGGQTVALPASTSISSSGL